MKYSLEGPRTCYKWFPSEIEKKKTKKTRYGRKVLRSWVLIFITFRGKISCGKNLMGELLLGPLKLIQVKFVISTVLVK